MPETRTSTLETIYTWLEVDSTSQPSIFWVWGLAGTGKSAIAQTVATHEAGRKRLGASFFFSRDRAQQKNPLLLFPTIAFQLARFDPQYKQRLAESLEDSAAPDAHVLEQLSGLIVKPWLASGPRPTPILIIIDALDECDPNSEAETIVKVLAAELPKLNGSIKVLITSRPEFGIHSRFESSGLKSMTTAYTLHDIDKTIVGTDIQRYLEHHLRAIAEDYGVAADWPAGDDVKALTAQAGAFFIVAATAIKFIADREWSDPLRQLGALVEGYRTPGGGAKALNEVVSLYLKVLNQAMASRNPDILARFRKVVGTIVLLQDPLSSESLDALLGESAGTVRATLLRLHSLLLVPQDQTTPIRIFHQSFADLITGRVDCPDPSFQIDPSVGHAQIATNCFKLLSSLQKDMCRIGDPSRLNSEVTDLREKVAKALPKHIEYACLYVSSHVANSSSKDDDLRSLVTEFCKSKVLIWIEALSYLEHLDVAVPALRALRKWCTVCANTASTGMFTHCTILDYCRPRRRHPRALGRLRTTHQTIF